MRPLLCAQDHVFARQSHFAQLRSAILAIVMRYSHLPDSVVLCVPLVVLCVKKLVRRGSPMRVYMYTHEARFCEFSNKNGQITK